MAQIMLFLIFIFLDLQSDPYETLIYGVIVIRIYTSILKFECANQVMGKIKELEISKQEISEIKTLAIHNKPNVMYKKLRIEIDGIEYSFIIKGVGRKSVKLELYIDYQTLLENKDCGVVEKRIYDAINTIYEKGKAVKSSDEVSE